MGTSFPRGDRKGGCNAEYDQVRPVALGRIDGSHLRRGGRNARPARPISPLLVIRQMEPTDGRAAAISLACRSYSIVFEIPLLGVGRMA
jgi:hypothetical protein